MDRPGNVLRGIAAKGRRIQADIIAIKRSKQGIDANADLVVEGLDILFDLSGHKRTAARLARRYGRASADSRIITLESEARAWESEAKDALRNMTVLQNGIPGKPNSDRLLRGFSTATRLQRTENRLSRGILYLEDLSERSVAYNDELTGMRKAVSAIGDSEKEKAPSEMEDRLALLAKNLEGFPTVQEAVQGALRTYGARGDDWARQTLGSMRNALESLVKLLSGEDDWSNGLVKLMPSQSRRAPIKVAYAFVSNLGPHNKEIPVLNDVDYGIGLVERAIRYVIEASGPKHTQQR